MGFQIGEDLLAVDKVDCWVVGGDDLVQVAARDGYLVGGVDHDLLVEVVEQAPLDADRLEGSDKF